MSAPLRLYSYWRSSASWRVRIALHLKDLAFETVPVHLVRGGGEHLQSDYRRRNPQSRVPMIECGDFRLNQSLAILDWLEQRHPDPPLVPAEPDQRARMWAFCHTICADIQPLQNLGPLTALVKDYGFTEAQRARWARHWIQRGLEALEVEYGASGGAGLFGDEPTLAECCLVPQLYNAERYDCDAARFPRLMAVGKRLATHPAFVAGHPNAQPDRPAVPN